MITLDKSKIEPVDIKLEDHAWDEMWNNVNKCVSYGIRHYVSTYIDEPIDDFLWGNMIGILHDHICNLIEGKV